MKSAFLVAMLGPGVLSASLLVAATPGHDAAPTMSSEGALPHLLAGNQRFVTGAVAHPDQSAPRRLAQAAEQTPTAIVLACSGSRVAPEILFDQGIGNIFVIRNAGNVLDDHVIGSIEYAVAHLHVPLVVVLGHAKCGAVPAAVEGGHAPGHFSSIVASIGPAVKFALGHEGEAVDNTVRANARLIRDALADSEPLIGPAVKTGKIKVVAGLYEITSGKVLLLP
jgi:carbonic anhydrase